MLPVLLCSRSRLRNVTASPTPPNFSAFVVGEVLGASVQPTSTYPSDKTMDVEKEFIVIAVAWGVRWRIWADRPIHNVVGSFEWTGAVLHAISLASDPSTLVLDLNIGGRGDPILGEGESVSQVSFPRRLIRANGRLLVEKSKPESVKRLAGSPI